MWTTVAFCDRTSLIEPVNYSPSHSARLPLSLRITKAWWAIEQTV